MAINGSFLSLEAVVPTLGTVLKSSLGAAGKSVSLYAGGLGALVATGEAERPRDEMIS